jgi:hypothetical protein
VDLAITTFPFYDHFKPHMQQISNSLGLDNPIEEGVNPR